MVIYLVFLNFYLKQKFINEYIFKKYFIGGGYIIFILIFYN